MRTAHRPSTRLAPVLIFDGDCAFCTRSANLARRIGRGRFDVVPWQRADLDSLDLTVEQAGAMAWWVEPGTPPVGGHLAAAAVLLKAGSAWAVLGWLIGHRPLSVIAARLYGLIARNRYRLPGGTAACAVQPRPEDGMS